MEKLNKVSENKLPWIKISDEKDKEIKEVCRELKEILNDLTAD